MERSRSPGRIQKDMLLNQAKRCRERVQILRGLSDNVVTAVGEACTIANQTLTRVEAAADLPDVTAIKALCKEVRSVSNFIRKYEDALEAVMDIGDLDDREDNSGMSSFGDFDRSSSARNESTNMFLFGQETTHSNIPIRLSSPFLQEPLNVSATVTAASSEIDLIQFPNGDPPPPSPDFNTADSCGGSSYADALSNRPTRQNSFSNVRNAAAPENTQDATSGQEMPNFSNVGSSGETAATTAAASLAALAFTAPVNVPQDAFTEDDTPREASDLTPTSSEGVASSYVSQSENYTSTDSGDEEFIEGQFVPPGQFYFTEDNSVRFYMRHIITPDEFYVQPLSHETSAAFSQLRGDLNRFYDVEENRKPLCPDCDTDLNVGLFGVCSRREYFTNQQDIERCQITDVKMERRQVQIHFIDLGVKQLVPVSQVWKIDQRFCKIPALTIRCRLFDTRPRDEGIAKAFGGWSDEAVTKFKSLCDGDRPMTGNAMNKREPFGLMAYSYRGVSKVCVNLELVSEKFAKSLTNWVKANDLAPAVAQDHYRTQSEEDAGANINVDFLCFGTEASPLPPPLLGTTVLVEVQKFFSCCRFSVNFPMGVGHIFRIRTDPQYKERCEEPIRRYKNAIDEMNETYAREDDHVFAQWPLVGQLVASEFSEDKRHYRARLLDVAPQDYSARVRYVDYGNDEWVSIETLRPLAPQYLSLPYMAMECRLAGVRPIPRVSMTGDNINALMEHARSQSLDKCLLAEVKELIERQPPAGPVLSVVLSSEDRSVNFNDYVVEQGWAERENPAM